MKILVPIKRVPESDTVIQVQADGSGIAADGIKFAVNPFCEIAIEAALQIKDRDKETEIVLITIGPEEARRQLRSGFSMGADRGIHVVTDEEFDPSAIAEILHKLVLEEQPNLVILGKQAIDDDANQTGQRLAAHLDWPQATFASDIEVSEDASSVTVVREVDGGLETVAFQLPGVITTDLRLAKPRYGSLLMQRKAKDKEVREVTAEELCLTPKARVVSFGNPPTRPTGRRVSSVAELVELLQSEAKVL